MPNHFFPYWFLAPLQVDERFSWTTLHSSTLSRGIASRQRLLQPKYKFVFSFPVQWNSFRPPYCILFSQTILACLAIVLWVHIGPIPLLVLSPKNCLRQSSFWRFFFFNSVADLGEGPPLTWAKEKEIK